MTPQNMFKFVSSADAVIKMTEGYLKFTPIDELNDPSELAPVINHEAVKNSLNLLRKTGFNEQQFQWLKHQGEILDLLSPEQKKLNAPKSIEEANRIISSPIYENIDYMQKMLFYTIINMRKKVGIFSLTERYNSLPMWAHYAKNATGYVFQFENLHHTFSGDKTGSLNTLKSIKYSEILLGMTFDPLTQDNLFFSKFSDWSYEREWRVVTSLNTCKFDSNNGCYLKQTNSTHVKRIICGWKVEKNAINEIREKLSKINSDIKIVTAKFENGDVIIPPL